MRCPRYRAKPLAALRLASAPVRRETAAGFTPATPTRSGELLGKITAAITSNPDYALSVQGNINHNVAERLMA